VKERCLKKKGYQESFSKLPYCQSTPQLKDFLVNPVAKFYGIERQIQMEKVCFLRHADLVSSQESLVRSTSAIIPAKELVANPFFGAEFEDRLKEVDLQTPILVNTL
jgi:hypothetical protein